LFSGSGVIVSRPNSNSVILRTDKVHETIADCKSELIEGCQKNILEASTFFIDAALTAAREKESSDADAQAVAFIEALIDAKPILEQKLCLLINSLNVDDLKRYTEGRNISC